MIDLTPTVYICTRGYHRRESMLKLDEGKLCIHHFSPWVEEDSPQGRRILNELLEGV